MSSVVISAPFVEDRLLKPAEAARYFGVTKWTLAEWRAKGKGPRYVVFARGNLRYRLSDIQAFIAEQDAIGGRKKCPRTAIAAVVNVHRNPTATEPNDFEALHRARSRR